VRGRLRDLLAYVRDFLIGRGEAVSRAACQPERDERRRVLVTLETGLRRSRPAILSPKNWTFRTCTETIAGHARAATSAENVRPQAS
jgi:hypothetical protein